MSILIKGMKMPRNCDDCHFDIDCTYDESQDGYKMMSGRPRKCPLVHVPPHGRLIDADELFKEMERKGWFDNADRDKAEDIVLAAPTIMEAEEGEQ